MCWIPFAIRRVCPALTQRPISSFDKILNSRHSAISEPQNCRAVARCGLNVLPLHNNLLSPTPARVRRLWFGLACWRGQALARLGVSLDSQRLAPSVHTRPCPSRFSVDPCLAADPAGPRQSCRTVAYARRGRVALAPYARIAYTFSLVALRRGCRRMG